MERQKAPPPTMDCRTLRTAVMGIDFGSQTEGFLRLSYANSIDNLAEAMRRLEAYIRQR